MQNTSPLDYETRTTFSLNVQAQDDGPGQLKGSAIVTINLQDVNEQPIIQDASRTVNENVPLGTQVNGAAVTGTDVDDSTTLAYSITACTPNYP